jgi:hypothetical protein
LAKIKNRKNTLKTGDFAFCFMKNNSFCEESAIGSATPTKPSWTSNSHVYKQLSPLTGDFDIVEIAEIAEIAVCFLPPMGYLRIKN